MTLKNQLIFKQAELDVMANEQERWTTCKTVDNVKKNYRKNKEVAPKSAQKQ